MPDETCSIKQCPTKRYARGWCRAHYARWHRTGTPYGKRRTRGQCTYDDCQRPYFARGWCAMHYQRDRKHGDLEHTRRSDCDPVAVERTLAGDPPAALTLAEREECIRQLHARGCHDRQIARLVHMSQAGVCMARARLELPALTVDTQAGAA